MTNKGRFLSCLCHSSCLYDVHIVLKLSPLWMWMKYLPLAVKQLTINQPIPWFLIQHKNECRTCLELSSIAHIIKLCCCLLTLLHCYFYIYDSFNEGDSPSGDIHIFCILLNIFSFLRRLYIVILINVIASSLCCTMLMCVPSHSVILHSFPTSKRVAPLNLCNDL